MTAFARMLESAAGRPVIGTWLMSASPIVAEAAGCAGFDWAVVDMEHTPLDLMDVVHMLQAIAATPMLPIVRVPWNDAVVMKRVLDAGATTLLVPFVQSADEARAAVAATRYPPEGRRGVAAMSRASRFGTTPDFVRTANGSIAVVVQLETIASIDAVDAIAAVPGVDALFVGPADLSASIGVVGQAMHASVVDATARAVAGARAAGKPIGTVGPTPEIVQRYRAMGFDFTGVASDLGLFMRSAQAAIVACRLSNPPSITKETPS